MNSTSESAGWEPTEEIKGRHRVWVRNGERYSVPDDQIIWDSVGNRIIDETE